ncbi:MAG: hypothetical protein KDA33_17225, partial [Phycisphaerales bacterium]|nr:hypothetical protein [Phycisphaerales bacterium]
AAACALLCLAIWLGACAGLALIGEKDAELGTLLIVAGHLYVTCLCIVGLSMATSGMSNRRSVSIGICFFYVFYSFVLNVLEAFWPAAERIGFTGFMHFYKPLPIARDAAWQWGNLGILMSAGLIIWVIGWLRFAQRDLPGA